MQIYCYDIERILRRHRNTIIKWFTDGKLNGRKMGDHKFAAWATTREELEKFIKRPLTEDEIALIKEPRAYKRKSNIKI